jgi:hypothetical protein
VAALAAGLLLLRARQGEDRRSMSVRTEG